jgi:RimJ/RimL family protein N-acetyltransferase
METPRLVLEPLRAQHADEMFPVLDDRRLYRYIGGEPPSLDQLRTRYAKQLRGHSADGAQGWLNWVVRHRATQAVLGTVQATLSCAEGRLEAEIAWVMAVAYQGQGYAKEATEVMVGWLARHGAALYTAHIHPEHGASIGVARHLGMTATDVTVDGETRWVSIRGWDS